MNSTVIDESAQMIAVPGGQIHVKRWDPADAGDRAPLLLLHDSLGCVELWRQFPRTLCAALNRTIVAYDRLGFGQSSARAGLPSARFVSEEGEQILPVLLGQLGLRQPVLLGHSVGGSMAVVFAARAGGCSAVITESAQAFVELRTFRGIAKAREDFKDPAMLERLRRYHGEKARWVVDAWTENWLSRPFAHWSLQDDLPRLRCPVLAIHGDRDEYGSEAFPQMISEMAGAGAQQHLIADCGHVPHREKEELIVTLIAQFLEGLAAPARRIV